MILALAGQFKQLSHEPEKFCDAGAMLSPTELWSHTVESRSICFKHRIAYNILSYDIAFTGKTWAQQIDLLSTVWFHSSVGESTAPASQRSWVRIPLSHLNVSGSWDNCLNCPASARIISSLDFKHRTSYNTSFILHSFHGKTWAQQIDLLSTAWLRSSVG